jgi:hypothetical protein
MTPMHPIALKAKFFMLYGAMDENTFSRINCNEKLNGQGAIDEKVKRVMPRITLGLACHLRNQT